MLAPSVMVAMIVQGQSISLGREESLTAGKNLNESMISSLESSTVTKPEETQGMQRWKAPQARNLNFGKGGGGQETNWNLQA